MFLLKINKYLLYLICVILLLNFSIPSKQTKDHTMPYDRCMQNPCDDSDDEDQLPNDNNILLPVNHHDNIQEVLVLICIVILIILHFDSISAHSRFYRHQHWLVLDVKRKVIILYLHQWVPKGHLLIACSNFWIIILQ